MTNTTRDAIGRFGLRTGLRLMASACVIAAASSAFAQQEKPNIVLIFMDNFGWGELGTYGAASYAVRRRLGSTVSPKMGLSF